MNRKITNEVPYIPCGIFKIRLPFLHYRIETTEFIQGLVLGVTALSAVPYLETYMGIPYELAWSIVILDCFLYMLHGFPSRLPLFFWKGLRWERNGFRQ